MVGSARLLLEHGVALVHPIARVEHYEAGAKTVIMVAHDQKLVGMIAVADTLKEDAEAAIERLHAQGIETVMMTGDNRRTAESIAAQIGIDMVFAEILPQGKAGHVRQQ